MVKLVLVRHARTAWNAEGRLQGRTDIGLDETGRAQALRMRLPAHIKTLAWWSSPLRRAVETATLMGLQFGIEPLLVEMAWGQWEGHRLADLDAAGGEEMRRNEARGIDFRPPGGESPRDVQRRLKPWLIRIGSAGGDIGAVTHNGVIRALYALATGWDMTGRPPVKLRDGALQVFAVDGQGRIAADVLNLWPESLECRDR